MKRNKNWYIFQAIALALQLLAELLLGAVVLKLNMLPHKYMVVFIAVLGALPVLTGLLMFIKVKGNIALWRRILSCVLAILLACGCVLVSKFAMDTYNLLHSVTGDNSGEPETYVMVLKEDTAQTLKDTKGYTFAAVEGYDAENTQKLLHVMETETGAKPQLTYYKQAETMADALYRKEVDAMIISGVSISFLEEQLAYQGLLDQMRILYTLKVEEEKEEPKVPDAQGLASEPFVVYISGSDTRNKKLTVSRSDVNILAVINPKTKQILLVNTPRDYFVPNSAGEGALDKLTHCGNYGIDCSIDALEGLYDVQVDKYGKINFYGFKTFIDAIGGITVYSEEAFTTHDGVYIKKGENTLNGKQALSFSRDRHHVSGGDNGRGKNQMRVIKAVIDKLTGSTTLISNYGEILKSLEGMLVTSFQVEEISDLVKMQLSDMAQWNVQSFAVTGRGDMQITYSYPGEKLSVMWPDEEAVSYASGLIGRVMKGEILTEADMDMPE